MCRKIIFLLVTILLIGCSSGPEPIQIADGSANGDGHVRVSTAAGVMEFTTISGLSGERITGVEVTVAVIGETQLVYAEPRTAGFLPVAAPLMGETTVRRLAVPPQDALAYNIATASGQIDLSMLDSLGRLSEDQVQQRLRRGGDQSVLIYHYNPARPLALTAAELDAWATPFPNVTVLKSPAEPNDAPLALLIVGLDEAAYGSWSHKVIDRYLAGRIGTAPVTDLRGDLTFGWAYPVFEVYPPATSDDLALGGEEETTLLINWRSRFPDPPPPWSFVVSTDSDELITIDPPSFPLGPDQPPRELRVMLNREGLEPGEYSATVFIQPYSDAFGLIEQPIEREISFTVAEAPPTATPGPETYLAVTPAEPREGDTMVVTAEGFEPNEGVIFELLGPERNIRDALPTADDQGNFRYEVDLATVSQGVYTLRLTGVDSDIVTEQEVIIGEKIADATVTTDQLNLRFEPFCDAPVLEVLVRGDELTIISVNGDDSWLEVVTQAGEEGWVVSKLVNIRIDLSTIPWNQFYPTPTENNACAR